MTAGSQSAAQRLVGDIAPKREELVETIIHLAFYAGWPKAMSAIQIAREVFAAEEKREN